MPKRRVFLSPQGISARRAIVSWKIPVQFLILNKLRRGWKNLLRSLLSKGAVF